MDGWVGTICVGYDCMGYGNLNESLDFVLPVRSQRRIALLHVLVCEQNTCCTIETYMACLK